MRKNMFFLIAIFLFIDIIFPMVVFSPNSQKTYPETLEGLTLVYSETDNVIFLSCDKWLNCKPDCDDPKWCYKGDCCESKERIGGVKCVYFSVKYKHSGKNTVKVTFLKINGSKLNVRFEEQGKQPITKTFSSLNSFGSYLKYKKLRLWSISFWSFFPIHVYYGKLQLGQALGFNYSKVRLFVIGEETYKDRKAWVIGLKPYENHLYTWIGNVHFISKYDGKLIRIYEIAWNKYHAEYFIKVDRLKILVDKETGLLLYVDIDFSFYSKAWGDNVISNLSILEDCENIGAKGETHYRLEATIYEKRKSPGKLCFILEKDLDYSKGKYIVEKLAGYKLRIIKDHKSKTIELDNCGCVNVTKLYMVDKNGKIIPGKYTIDVDSKVSLPKLIKWNWYYKTSYLFPIVRISYTVDVDKEGFTIKIDKAYNARIVNRLGEDIFKNSPLDVTSGGEVRLRTVEAWDKMMRYAVYRFLISAGVSQQTASSIRDIPVYYSQKVDHFKTLWWNQIELYHDAASTYTFSSDKPDRISEILEGIFHEYGHAVREYLWKDPSIVFRYRMLGGGHPSPSKPSKTSWVAFDEGHSDFFAYLVYNYMLDNLYDLLDIPIGKIDDYSGAEYKGSKYLGDVVEGRIAGLLLRILYDGDETKAYKLFLSVCNKAKQITGYSNPYYSTTPRPPRDIDEWLAAAYLIFPDKRNLIQKYASEYNMFFVYRLPNAKKGSVSGKLIVVYHLDSILPRFNAWYSPAHKDEDLQALWEYTVWRIEDGSYFDSKDSYNLLFLEDNVFYVSPGTRLSFHKDYIEVVKGEIMYQSSKTGKWVKVKAKGYSIIRIKSLCVIKVKDDKVTFTMIDGEITLYTPRGVVKLRTGKSLIGSVKSYKISNVDAKKEVLKYKIEKMILQVKNNEIDYGKDLYVSIRNTPKGHRLLVYAYNVNTTSAKKLFDKVVSQDSINIKFKLDAGQYIIFAYTYDKNKDVILSESNAQKVKVRPLKVKITLESNLYSVPLGGKIKVKCILNKEIKGIVFLLISPTGNISSITIKDSGTIFEREIALNQAGNWTITVKPIDSNIIVEKQNQSLFR